MIDSGWMPYIGYTATVLSSLAFIPQAVKTIKTKDTSGLSLGMYAILTASVVMWLLYGIGAKSMPMILTNAIILVFSSIILAMKIRYK